jgi:hypothetical protein
MSSYCHLSWDNFARSMLVHNEKRVLRVGGPPWVEIFGDGESNTIGLWVECDPQEVIASDLQLLETINIRHVHNEGRQILEVSTKVPSLFRNFYIFATAVADAILQDQKSALDAVRLELQMLGALLETKPLLSLERQVGLLGELLFLEHLIKKIGPIAISAWMGPRGEPHDFRFNNIEIEVKTTTGSRRIHTINGAQQLVPSPNHDLCILSILLGPPGGGGGISLALQIQLIQDLLVGYPLASESFISLMRSCGYEPADHDLYSRKFNMRRPFAIAIIRDRFPALTNAILNATFGEQAVRFESVQYDINIEGLEKEEDTPEYRSVIDELEVVRSV